MKVSLEAAKEKAERLSRKHIGKGYVVLDKNGEKPIVTAAPARYKAARKEGFKAVANYLNGKNRWEEGNG